MFVQTICVFACHFLNLEPVFLFFTSFAAFQKTRRRWIELELFVVLDWRSKFEYELTWKGSDTLFSKIYYSIVEQISNFCRNISAFLYEKIWWGFEFGFKVWWYWIRIIMYQAVWLFFRLRIYRTCFQYTWIYKISCFIIDQTSNFRGKIWVFCFFVFFLWGKSDEIRIFHLMMIIFSDWDWLISRFSD